MRQISCSVMALTLAMTSAFAQEAINKNDLPDPRTSIDQTPVSIGEIPITGAAPAAGRNRISNALSNSTDLNLNNRQQATPGREVIQQQAVLGSTIKAPVTSEFQKFVSESLGKPLPIFGAEFFNNTPSTFAPVQNTPVPAEYPLGPGDEILVRGWGTIDIDYRATIDRNGLITIPTVGSVVLGGVKASEAETVVRNAIAKLYKNVNLNVSFGQLRAITVYVVGQANRPGTYTVSSLSTLVTALFASGGPNANGSMRRVQVKRAGKVAAELDLYAFIAKGDKSADIKLQDGDTIYIPAASGHVAFGGKVNTPAIYELRTNKDTIESLLEFSGGLPVVADPRRAYLERIEPGKNQPRTVEQFALNAEGLKHTLKNGDILNVASITPDFSNAVVLRGNVDQPIRAPFKAGMRISDLIPSREYLLSRSSIQRQNSVVNEIHQTPVSQIGGYFDEINWDYAVIERVNRADLSVALLPFNLGKIFQNPAGSDNVELHPGDTVTIFSQNDMAVPIDKRRVFVRVEGEVNVPGIYQMSPGDNLHTLIARAGGPTSNAYLFGTAFYREKVRVEQEGNIAKISARLENQIRSEQARLQANMSHTNLFDAQAAEQRRQAAVDSARQTIANFRQMKPNGRVSFGLPPEERSFNRLPQLKLESGDALVIPARPDFVHVFGAVNVESAALWRPGMTVGKYLKSAGLTSDADLENAFVMRADGSVVSGDAGKWFTGGVTGIDVMPGDTIVVPEKADKETAWSRFTVGLREWSQILANLGLGAAAIKTLK